MNDLYFKLSQELANVYRKLAVDTFLNNDNKLIYHYTSPDGLRGIITNQTLRFTDRYFLNDYSEVTYVLDLCENNINKISPDNEKFKEELKKQLKKTRDDLDTNQFRAFQCSFSIDNDNLCLWNYYTKGNNINGYNLCFDAKNLCEKFNLEPVLESGNVPRPLVGRVIYNEDEQISKVKEVVNEFWQVLTKYFDNMDKTEVNEGIEETIESIVEKLLVLGTFFKKKCFEIENEYRVCFYLFEEKNGDFGAINMEKGYFEKNGLLIPYVDIKFKNEALKGIKISPTLNLNDARRSLLRITRKNFQYISTDSITVSQIPVRY